MHTQVLPGEGCLQLALKYSQAKKKKKLEQYGNRENKIGKRLIVIEVSR